MTLPNAAHLVLPISSPPFTIPGGTTAVQSMVLKSAWESDTKAYLEYMHMQLALKKPNLTVHRYAIPQGHPKSGHQFDHTIST